MCPCCRFLLFESWQNETTNKLKKVRVVSCTFLIYAQKKYVRNSNPYLSLTIFPFLSLSLSLSLQTMSLDLHKLRLERESKDREKHEKKKLKKGLKSMDGDAIMKDSIVITSETKKKKEKMDSTL
jgi:hypothetical protein